VSLFQKALSIIYTSSPGFQYEIETLIEKILPYDVDTALHNSASFQTAIGHMLMSYPEDIEQPELLVLEAILHEFSHTKMHLIMMSDDICLHLDGAIYYSPYRRDMREIQGIFL
jgi:HEXXH motif-containing protein